MPTQKIIAQAKGPVYIKIKSSDVIKSIRSGNLWFTSLKYYRDLYENSEDDTIGDKYEGKLIVNDFEFISSEMPKYNTNGIVKQHAFSTVNQNDYVFCLFSVHGGQQNINEFIFNDEQREKLLNFGDTALIFKDFGKFSAKVKLAVQEKNYILSQNEVNYYDPTKNDNRTIDLLKKGMSNIVFHKTNKYEYQQEYRFTIPFEGKYSDDKKFLTDINIGDISDITEVVPTEQLLGAIIKKSE